MHFFSPANIMRLVEIVTHSLADERCIATGMEFAQRIGKLPVVVNDGFGFVGNRIYAAYRRQAEFLVEEGASPEQVDGVMESFGFPMGPFAVGDLSGLDIAWRMRRAGDSERTINERYVAIADRLVEAGRLGRKTGAGWYAYEPDWPRGRPDPFVTGLILKEAEKKGVSRKPLKDEQILRRLLVTIVNEASLILAEKVTNRTSDIDLVMVHGFGFPRHEGGPVYWAKSQSQQWLYDIQSEIGALAGSEFRPAGIGNLSA